MYFQNTPIYEVQFNISTHFAARASATFCWTDCWMQKLNRIQIMGIGIQWREWLLTGDVYRCFVCHITMVRQYAYMQFLPTFSMLVMLTILGARGDKVRYCFFSVHIAVFCACKIPIVFIAVQVICYIWNSNASLSTWAKWYESCNLTGMLGLLQYWLSALWRGSYLYHRKRVRICLRHIYQCWAKWC